MYSSLPVSQILIRKSYQPVVSKPVKFFKVQKNTIYERARFNPRDQREGESIKQCIIALYELKRCADMIAQKRQHSYPAVMGWLRCWLSFASLMLGQQRACTSMNWSNHKNARCTCDYIICSSTMCARSAETRTTSQEAYLPVCYDQ